MSMKTDMDDESENEYECPSEQGDGDTGALTELQTPDHYRYVQICEGFTPNLLPPPHATEAAPLGSHCRGTSAGQLSQSGNRSKKAPPAPRSEPKRASTMNFKSCPQENRTTLSPDSSKMPHPGSRLMVFQSGASERRPAPPVPTPPSIVQHTAPAAKAARNAKKLEANVSTNNKIQVLDPSWYSGKVTRREAEVTLREFNQDGTFVVRDSSNGSAGHPYTLMVLKQSKVYNIKIHKQGDSYFLGTGRDYTKRFPGVKEMISYHALVPLLLIHATEQICQGENQCRLLHPAGV